MSGAKAHIAAAVCTALCGCSSTIYKTYSLDDDAKRPVVMTVDAKQRFAFIVPRDVPATSGARSDPHPHAARLDRTRRASPSLSYLVR